MNKPKMILFDYGQTLVDEERFDGVKGTEAVLKYATRNKYNKTAQEIQAVADAINDELGRFDPKRKHLLQTEVSNRMFDGYLYESQGIELSISGAELDKVFWDAAAPGKATEGLGEFLAFLKAQGIRTGVISNIGYCGEAVKERIDSTIPGNDFEFIIATSEYMFRKPNPRIFGLALEKADLQPEEVWYVGDQFECDIVGAQNAGLTPVWYVGASKNSDALRKDGEDKGVLTVKEWSELQEILSREEKLC